MVDRVESFLRDLASALQVAKIYTTDHPKFKDLLNQTFNALSAILAVKDEFIIGIVGEEIAFEKEIFFDLSNKLRNVIKYLKGHSIEKITFYSGLELGELDRFIRCLLEFSAGEEGGIFDLSKAEIRNIVVGRIGLEPSVKEKKALAGEKQYEDLLEKISKMMGAVLDEQKLDYIQLRFNIVNVFEGLMRQGDFLKVATMKKYDPLTFGHLFNVSIIAMYFSSKLGFSNENILDIGIAALFHDIGKIHISRNIISKTSKLSDEEFHHMQSHSSLGAQILLRYTDSMGILPVVVAFEHHIRYDGGGYPSLFFNQKPQVASRIVSICDVYDALFQRRSYKRDYPPLMIHTVMTKERGGYFDPDLLDSFFRIMGVWPLGTMVALSDDRIAVVKDENEDSIYCPKVEIIFPKDKKEIIDLKKRSDVAIVRFLNPLTEGKQYLEG